MIEEFEQKTINIYDENKQYKLDNEKLLTDSKCKDD